MGHDTHAGMSPAHRRNQNPVSPSASLFRRSSTLPREESDSWMALFRRHRFLLLTLALLAFLCTVYLYFAIKLGAESCSGLSAQEEARCRLKRSEVKPSLGHRSTRGLLNIKESTLEPWVKIHIEVPTLEPWVKIHIEVPTIEEMRIGSSWMSRLTKDNTIEKVPSLGCTGMDLTQYLMNRFSVSLPGIGCKERILELPPNWLEMEVLDTSWLFDLIICENCSLLELTTGHVDESKFWKVDRLLRHEGFFLWISEDLTVSSDYAIANVQTHGWAFLSRINGMVLWQKV